MLRTVSLVALVLLVAPPAYGAAGGPSIAIGPDGIVDPSKDPYFVWITFGSPQINTAPTAEDDCGADATRRPGPPATIMGIVAPILTWDPTEYLSVNEVFPQCIATQVSAPCPGPICPPPLPARAYAAYDTGTGDFYIEAAAETDDGLALPIGARVLPDTQNAEQTFVAGGNSGVMVLTDCAQCPAPP